MKRKKIALFDPYLDTMGGGERHILSVLKVLNENGYDIDIFWQQDLSEEFESKLNIIFDPYVRFKNNWPNLNSINRFQMLGKYDMFFYVTDGSYFFSSAKKTYIFCMVPQRSLYSMSPLNKLKTLNSTFISNAKYTQKWLNLWGIQSKLIYPFIDQEFIDINSASIQKKNNILCSGRFFRHLHSKRQDKAIEWFIELKKSNAAFSDYRLILAGSVKKEDLEYVRELQKQANNRSDIIFKINTPFEELKELYTQAAWYWHFAGFDVDENLNPESVEHLGITPLEAMASGCITCAYRIGGPTETIEHEKTGILFKTRPELFEAMTQIAKDTKRQQAIRKAAKTFVTEHFSYEVFKKRVMEIIS